MSSIKSVNYILFWSGADYSNYYYLLFFSTIRDAPIDSDGNVPVRGGAVCYFHIS